MLNCVQILATPWAVAHQAPLSTGFSRQEYQRHAVSSSRDLPDLGIKPMFLVSSALAEDSLPLVLPWKPKHKLSARA